MTYQPDNGNTPGNETIMAALMDALCSPQLYEITVRNGELLIKPRADMHARGLAPAE
jgi:hypothetical protein